MPSVLIHSCCGPCATYTIKLLQQEKYDVSSLWYNPNIHPYTEHQNRLDAMQKLSREWSFPLIVNQGYEIIKYFRDVVGHEANRCADCYRIRLNKTACIARENNFDAFTTTLLISPYQDHRMIRQLGDKASYEYGVEFLFRDFTPGFRQSHELANELGLYRQKYCGCVYSEYERYAKVKIQ